VSKRRSEGLDDLVAASFQRKEAATRFFLILPNSFFESFNLFYSRPQFALEVGSDSLNFLDISQRKTFNL